MLKLKFVFLFFAYAILLVHNCIPHHHHVASEVNEHAKIDPGSSKIHHHASHENHTEHHHHVKDAHDHEANENPYSHFIHALDLSVFISNQSDFSFAKEDVLSSNVILANELIICPVSTVKTLVFNFTESSYFRSLFNHSGLRAPPIC